MSIYGAQTADAPKFDDEAHAYDALLVLSFGGPEAMDDVIPFLQNVAEGRNIPRERLEEVAAHYYDFGGVSPINAQNRALIAALETRLKETDLDLPIYFGNRNWHPFVTDTIRQMVADGVKRVLVLVTSAFSSYSGCRQYREDVIRACETVGEGVPVFDKLRVFYNHPGFIEPMIEKTQQALNQFPAELRQDVHVIFTAHSIPMGMARHSDYVVQLEEVCQLVADRIGTTNYKLVYQSRSGPPQVPWLEPDICDYLTDIHKQQIKNVLIVPIGFISDHMEVLFDLDTEAQQLATELGINLARAETVGIHPTFIEMIHELILERMTDNPERRYLGTRGPNHDVCPLNCCLKGEGGRPSAPSA
ncbi:ferrochelatase [Anaerolineae bacterium CFX8]|nr:ferrochelatase [Anaerolineae bacterium CFX8]